MDVELGHPGMDGGSGTRRPGSFTVTSSWPMRLNGPTLNDYIEQNLVWSASALEKK